ncbi:hypothetical protein [Fimbriiglobus ruber]|uniref:Uncharacterized protein n=1 Tax=Fimbriiglobus ruber TaxID=1908690 RepID=A0A225D001_9BACT|nr:hypothetical protein [Fimbriiglobus ruber]OWK34263.1 hypothetical protein FRUB_10234 [Fimbriiglobus ruber]
MGKLGPQQGYEFLIASAEGLEAEAAELRKKATAIREAETKAKPLADRLVYAAHSRCSCGAGLAYDPAHDDPTSPHHGPTFWDCSAIILGTADKSVKHTGRLPFAFYEVKSEGQPSAYGATTRPSHAMGDVA